MSVIGSVPGGRAVAERVEVTAGVRANPVLGPEPIVQLRLGTSQVVLTVADVMNLLSRLLAATTHAGCEACCERFDAEVADDGEREAVREQLRQLRRVIG